MIKYLEKGDGCSIKDLFSYRVAECINDLDRKLNMRFHTFACKVRTSSQFPLRCHKQALCGAQSRVTLVLFLEAWPSEGFTLLPMEQWVCRGGGAQMCWCSLCGRVHGLPSCGSSWICGCLELAVVGVWLSGCFSWEIVCFLFTELLGGKAFP